MSLAGEGPGGHLALCHQCREREISSKGAPPSFSHPLGCFIRGRDPGRFPPLPVAPEELYHRAGPGFASAERPGSPGSTPTPVGRDAGSRRGSPGKAQGLGVPGLLAQPPRIIRAACEPGCALGRVCSLSAFSPPFFFFFLPPRIIKTLVVTLTAGNDNYLNLDHGSDPCYR